MKRPFSFGLSLMLSLGLANAQNLGCTYTFAPEYDPSADTNDGTCTYDVQSLINEGYCLEELLAEGLPPYVFYGITLYDGGADGRAVITDLDTAVNKIAMVYEPEPLGNYNSYPLKVWGCQGTTVGSNSPLAWTGDANTVAIVTNTCHLNDGVESAAEYCYNFEALGYADWFLPSSDDLDAAGQNLSGSDWYTTSSANYISWSSSEYGGSPAHQALFGYADGSWNYTSKNNLYRVRPFRYQDIGDLCSGDSDACASWFADQSPAGVGCDYPLFSCDSLESVVWQDLPSQIYPRDETSIQFGLEWSRELQLNLRNEVLVDGNTYDVVSITVNGVAGLPEGLELGGELSYNANEHPNGNVLCLALTGAPLETGAFELVLTATVNISFLGTTVELGQVDYNHLISVIENTDGIPGCMYSWADNYNPLATQDDLSCEVSGLNTCQEDFDANGIIGVGDILHVLGMYGGSCD